MGTVWNIRVYVWISKKGSLGGCDYEPQWPAPWWGFFGGGRVIEKLKIEDCRVFVGSVCFFLGGGLTLKFFEIVAGFDEVGQHGVFLLAIEDLAYGGRTPFQ